MKNRIFFLCNSQHRTVCNYITETKGYDILVREIWKATTINFTIDGKSLVAKKNETWRDWLIRMKDEPEEVVGHFVYYGWHEAKTSYFEEPFDMWAVYFVEYGGINVFLYEQTSRETVSLGMPIESERRILFTRRLT